MAKPEQEVGKIIRVGDTLTNALDRRTKQSVTYTKVTKYFDGSEMDDLKADGYIYRKVGSEYFLKNLGEYGQVLQKDTVADMRELSDLEILLLRMGYYKHVQLNGYYEKEDTPAPINYVLSNTADADDGGSVIEVGGVKLAHDFVGYLDPLYFGAVGDGAFDNKDVFSRITQFLNKKSGVQRFRLRFSNKTVLGYQTSDSFRIPRYIDVEMRSPLWYIGTPDKPAMIIGESGSANERIYLKLDIRNRVQSTWEEDQSDCIGCVIYNLYESTQVYLDRVQGFYEGYRLIGDGSGFVYNEIDLGAISNNKIGIRLTNSNASSIGWCNENKFNNGRFAVNRNTHTNKSRYGIVIDTLDGTYENNNNNNFYKPSFELIQPTGGSAEAVGIVVKSGQQNAFYDCRNEGNGPILFRTEGSAQRNILEVGYGLATYEDLGLYPSTYAIDRQTYIRYNSPSKLIYDSGDLTTKVMQYDASRAYFEGALLIGSTNNANRGKLYGLVTSAYEDLIPEGESIRIATTRLIGVRVNTENCKQFRISKTTLANSAPARLFVNCYDAEGVLLTGTEGRYATGDSQLTLGYQNIAGGSYITSGVNGDIYFSVKPAVKYVDVMLTGAGAAVNLVSFQVYALNGYSNVIDPLGKEGLYAIQQPTTTIHKVGTFVKNDNPVNNGNGGWIFCNDNTWKPLGIIGLGNASPTIKGLVNQSAVVANSSSAIPATDSSSTATDVAGVVTDLNDLISKYNSLRTVVNELQTQLNAKLTADRASGQQAT